MGAELVEGYLVIADVSGYTRFVTGTELEHSHQIVSELVDLIREHLAPPLEFVKVEGDAVLCFGRSTMIDDAERIVEIVERCYLAFHDRLFSMAQATTCQCDACREMATLDLKFVVHRGSFMLDEVGGRRDLSGPDVILVHRLLKNRVVADGGPQAYALFSGPCLECFSGSAALAPHVEEYGGFGEVPGAVLDLAAAADAMRDARRERLDDDTADVVCTGYIALPPSVVWQYITSPSRHRWIEIETGVDFIVNEQGRMGPGASSHCAHGELGGAVREYLDWKPFEYFTCRFTPEPGTVFAPQMIETLEFAADGDGCRVTWYVRAVDRSPEKVAALTAMAPIMQDLHSRNGPALEQLLAEEALA